MKILMQTLCKIISLTLLYNPGNEYVALTLISKEHSVPLSLIQRTAFTQTDAHNSGNILIILLVGHDFKMHRLQGFLCEKIFLQKRDWQIMSRLYAR